MKKINAFFAVLILGFMISGTSCSKSIKGCFLTLKVDGEAYEFKDAACAYANAVFSMTIGVGAANTLGFYINSIDAEGTFYTNAMENNVTLYFPLKDGTEVYIKEITVIVTKFTDKGVEGTLSGTVINSLTGDEGSITEGHFSGEY